MLLTVHPSDEAMNGGDLLVDRAIDGLVGHRVVADVHDRHGDVSRCRRDIVLSRVSEPSVGCVVWVVLSVLAGPSLLGQMVDHFERDLGSAIGISGLELCHVLALVRFGVQIADRLHICVERRPVQCVHTVIGQRAHEVVPGHLGFWLALLALWQDLAEAVLHGRRPQIVLLPALASLFAPRLEVSVELLVLVVVKQVAILATRLVVEILVQLVTG